MELNGTAISLHDTDEPHDGEGYIVAGSAGASATEAWPSTPRRNSPSANRHGYSPTTPDGIRSTFGTPDLSTSVAKLGYLDKAVEVLRRNLDRGDP
jgi:hypothetical protein